MNKQKQTHVWRRKIERDDEELGGKEPVIK
jgi:hypothetical protein